MIETLFSKRSEEYFRILTEISILTKGLSNRLNTHAE